MCFYISFLVGLRQRISTLFLQYCKTPLFNPEAARLLKVSISAYTRSYYRKENAADILPICTTDLIVDWI
jgi:hypothetical protein